MLGRDLIGRDADANVAAGGLAGLLAGEESRQAAGMVAGAVAVGAGLVQRQAAEDIQAIFIGRQRFKNLGQVERFAELLRCPFLHVRAVGHVEECQALRRGSRGRRAPADAAGQHRFEVRQCDRSAQALQDRSP